MQAVKITYVCTRMIHLQRVADWLVYQLVAFCDVSLSQTMILCCTYLKCGSS